MKILIDIAHPAHVHLFKNLIWVLQEKGHQIKITAREKDVTTQLLKTYDLEYENMGKPKGGLTRKLLGVLEKDYRMLKVAKKFQPDLLLSVGSPYSTHTSKLIRKPSIVFEDTEHSEEQYLLYAPFATVILTPQCFKLDLGKKQVRYSGYHELAYLHPKYFTPDPSVLNELGIGKDEKYVIVRFVSWEASHDIGQGGFSNKEKMKLVKEIEKYAIPLITSEGEMPEGLQKYQIKIPPHRMHDALYYASMYIGEGATMASEAAMLGVPAIYVNSITAGTLMEQEEYGLIFGYRNSNGVLEKAIELLNTPDLRPEWEKHRDKMLSEKIDVTAFMVQLTENYPESVRMLKGKSEFKVGELS